MGHTVESRGATSARGVGEYEFNFRLAQVIENYLKVKGLKNTNLLVADGVGRDQLEARRRKAAAIKPDFLISVHHDSVQDYLLSSWAHGGKRQAYNDRYSGFSIFVSRTSGNAVETLQFAKFLGNELIAHGLTFTTYHAEKIRGEKKELIDPQHGIYRNDSLAVLQNGALKVALLLEAGFIINRNEELELASSQRQSLVAAAIWSALNRFCGARRSPGTK